MHDPLEIDVDVLIVTKIFSRTHQQQRPFSLPVSVEYVIIVATKVRKPTTSPTAASFSIVTALNTCYVVSVSIPFALKLGILPPPTRHKYLLVRLVAIRGRYILSVNVLQPLILLTMAERAPRIWGVSKSPMTTWMWELWSGTGAGFTSGLGAGVGFTSGFGAELVLVLLWF